MKTIIKRKNGIKRILLIFIFIFSILIFSSCEFNQNNSNYITLSSDRYEIKIEETLSLPIAINNKEVEYISSDESIAKVNNNIVLGINPGNVVVSAVSNNKTVKKYVIVVKDDFASIEITGEEHLSLGASTTYSATISPNRLSQEVNWSSSDETVITIDENGMATAVGEGLAQVKASSKEHPSYFSSFTVLVTKTNDEGEGDVYSYSENTLNTSLLESLFYPIIEDAKSYLIGVNGYHSGFGKTEVSDTPASGIVYKRLYVLSSGQVKNSVNENDEVVSYKYYAITNRHVVKNTTKITVTELETGEEVNASIVQYDLKVDLAVITFDSKIYYSCAKFGNSDEVKSGDFVIALGSPFDYEYKYTASIGIISSTTRYLADDTDDDGTSDWDSRYIQHDAAINEGNNGGPLINLKGEVIGLNTLKISSVKTEDMGFAIPSNTFSELIDFLENGIQIVRPVLKVTAIEVKTILVSEYSLAQYPVPDGVTYGLYIVEVDDGVAKKAGVKPGDILLKINGVSIYYTYILRAELGKFIMGSNEECEIVVNRGGEEITLTVIF